MQIGQSLQGLPPELTGGFGWADFVWFALLTVGKVRLNGCVASGFQVGMIVQGGLRSKLRYNILRCPSK
jgi:hypothetical protein